MSLSRPLQIALALALVFAALWFTVLAPKDPAVEPLPAAAPAASTETPASAAGGEQATTGLGKAVEAANDAAAQGNADAAKASAQTGETDSSSAAPAATTPAATTPQVSEAEAKAARQAKATERRKAAKAASVKRAQQRADRVIKAVGKELDARKAVVLLVWSPSGGEDKIMKTRVTKKIAKRGGKVKVHLIKLSEIARYDGLLTGLDVTQPPSTIVIAPDRTAKVLGGIVGIERINRLTSAAVLVKPATEGATTP